MAFENENFKNKVLAEFGEFDFFEIALRINFVQNRCCVELWLAKHVGKSSGTYSMQQTFQPANVFCPSNRVFPGKAVLFV